MRVKNNIAYWLIAAIIIVISSFLTFTPPLFVQFIENKTFDIRFLLRGERAISDDIVIIAIDDQSLAEFGRWPWPRKTLAHLIDQAANAGAKTIGVDILLSEPTQNKHLYLIDELLRHSKETWPDHVALQQYLEQTHVEIDDDLLLSHAIRKAGNVILPFAPDVPMQSQHIMQTETPDVLFDHMFMMVKEQPFQQSIVASQMLLPLESFADAANALAHVYTQYDRDGAIRWEPLAIAFNGDYYPSFGLAVARHYLNIEQDSLQLISGEAIVMAQQVIATDRANRVLINYAGQSQTFPTYPALKLMHNQLNLDLLKDKIILIGLTALGTADNHVTPFAQLMGIEKQANVIENIIHQHFLHKGELIKLLNFLFICIFALMFLILISRWRALAGALLATTFILIYALITQYLFNAHLMWVDFLVPTGTIIVLYSSLTAYRFLIEEKKAREIKSMFSSYTTEKVVNELLAHPELAKLGGIRREVTVLFSDVRSFTSFSEKRTPEEVVKALNELLSAMTDVIFEWDGTLDKFVGDEIMVFWGAPAKQEEHALLALCCALDMMQRLAELQLQWVKQGRDVLDIGIGINTGEVVVGNIGSEKKKMDYTIIGDSVNLGARVEALTRNYNDHIIITEFTYQQIQKYLHQRNDSLSLVTTQKTFDLLYVKPLGSVKVKGKDLPVQIYEIERLVE